MTVRDLRELWLKEQPRYQRLCEEIEKLVKAQLQLVGIVPIEVVSRPKDPDSLLKKIVQQTRRTTK